MALADDFVYKHQNLPDECFKTFCDMRRKEEFCDVTLKVGSHSINAHKIILAASIPQFRTTFGCSTTEIRQSDIQLLMDVNPTALEAIIDFAYTCEVRITSDNAQMLLEAACFLQVAHVEKACVDFLLRRVTATGVLNLRKLGTKLDSSYLVHKVDDYVKENFEEVSQSEEFLDLPFLCVKKLVVTDDLHVSCENKVFEAIMRWVNSSPDERVSELSELLSCIRMPFLDLKYLRDHVATQELVKRSLLCRDILDDATDYHLFPEKNDGTYKWKFLLTLRRYKNALSESESASMASAIAILKQSSSSPNFMDARYEVRFPTSTGISKIIKKMVKFPDKPKIRIPPEDFQLFMERTKFSDYGDLFEEIRQEQETASKIQQSPNSTDFPNGESTSDFISSASNAESSASPNIPKSRPGSSRNTSFDHHYVAPNTSPDNRRFFASSNEQRQSDCITQNSENEFILWHHRKSVVLNSIPPHFSKTRSRKKN